MSLRAVLTMPSRYLSAAESHSQLGDLVTAKELAKLGLQMDEICLGTDNPLYSESRVRASRI